jgi:trk system potassium uptake protein
MAQYAVIGLGRFGLAVVETLLKDGHEVLAIDSDRAIVQKASEIARNCVELDSTDRSNLEAVGITSFDAVIVAIGRDLEASILTTMNLKELGAKRVLAKARDKTHADILEKVGADEVIFPERDTAIRLVHKLEFHAIEEILDMPGNYTLAKARIPKKLIGKTLRKAELRKHYNVNVVALEKDGKLNVNPEPDAEFDPESFLWVIGKSNDVERLVDSK